MNMTKEIELKIEGMHCDGCVRRVTALLKRVDGVEVESVVVGGAKVMVRDGVERVEVVKAVEGGGFKVAS
jgi:copper chaperone CopZ